MIKYNQFLQFDHAVVTDKRGIQMKVLGFVLLTVASSVGFFFVLFSPLKIDGSLTPGWIQPLNQAQAYVSPEVAKTINMTNNSVQSLQNMGSEGDGHPVQVLNTSKPNPVWQELEETKKESAHHKAEVEQLTARALELEAEKAELKEQLVVRTQNCVQRLTNEWEYSQQVLSDCLSEYTYKCTQHVQYPRLPIRPDVASEYFIQELETGDGIQLDTVPPQHSKGIEETGFHVVL